MFQVVIKENWGTMKRMWQNPPLFVVICLIALNIGLVVSR